MTDFHPENEAAAQAEAEIQATAQRAIATRALRKFVFRHNVRALLLALFSLLAAVLLWGALYLGAYLATLTIATLARSFSPATLLEINDPGLVGANFPWWFLGGAAAVLVIAGTLRKRVRFESLREAHLYLLWVIAELAMAIPNVTFSIWGNLSALVAVRRTEAARAWGLLERMDEEGGRLGVASLRMEIEDERVLRRVVFALQIVGLVEMRERAEGWFLYLQNRDAFALLNRGDQPA